MRNAMESGMPGKAELRRAFGNAIRKLRSEAQISQEDLASLSNIDRAYMSGLERGRHNPTIEMIYRLLPHLGVSFAGLAAEVTRQLAKKDENDRPNDTAA